MQVPLVEVSRLSHRIFRHAIRMAARDGIRAGHGIRVTGKSRLSICTIPAPRAFIKTQGLRKWSGTRDRHQAHLARLRNCLSRTEGVQCAKRQPAAASMCGHHIFLIFLLSGGPPFGGAPWQFELQPFLFSCSSRVPAPCQRVQTLCLNVGLMG
jgi:hypothetical protein